MTAGTTRAGRSALRRRLTPAALLLLATGLSALSFALVPAPQAALAASHGASHGAGALITAGSFHSCAIESGKAYCWGDNGSGQLGNGSTVGSSVPVAVDTSGVLAGQALTQITAGWYDTCALDASGAAYCWGYNADGELGNGSTVGSTVPVAVDTSGVLAGRTLTQVSAGTYSACAVDSAGAAYCWWANSWGQLGDNAATQSLVPVLAGPQAPASVTAIPGDTTATVSWRVPASLDTGILSGYTATAVPGGITCTAAMATTCTITGLTNGTAYSITVAITGGPITGITGTGDGRHP